jgi:hypothetical protein
MHADRDGADTKSTPSARNKIDASCVFHRVSLPTATCIWRGSPDDEPPHGADGDLYE